MVKVASTRLTMLAAFSLQTLLSPTAPLVQIMWEGGGRKLAHKKVTCMDRFIYVAEGAQLAQIRFFLVYSLSSWVSYLGVRA